MFTKIEASFQMDTARITCSAVGEPPPTIHWLHSSESPSSSSSSSSTFFSSSSSSSSSSVLSSQSFSSAVISPSVSSATSSSSSSSSSPPSSSSFSSSSSHPEKLGMAESHALLEVNIKRGFQQTPRQLDDLEDKRGSRMLSITTNQRHQQQHPHNLLQQQRRQQLDHRLQHQHSPENRFYNQKYQPSQQEEAFYHRLHHPLQEQRQDQYVTYVCFAQNKIGNVSFKVSIPILDAGDTNAGSDDDDDGGGAGVEDEDDDEVGEGEEEEEEEEEGGDKDGDFEDKKDTPLKTKAKLWNSNETRSKPLFPPCSSLLNGQNKKVGACIEDHSEAVDKDKESRHDGVDKQEGDNVRLTKDRVNQDGENIDKKIITNGSYQSSLMNGENRFTGGESWTDRKFTLPEIASAVVATHVTTMLVYAVILLLYYRRRAKWLRRKSSENKGEHKSQDNKILNGDLFNHRDSYKRNGFLKSNGLFGRYADQQTEVGSRDGASRSSKTTTLTKETTTSSSSSNNNNRQLMLCCRRRRGSSPRNHHHHRHHHQLQNHDYETFARRSSSFAQAMSPKLRRSAECRGSPFFLGRATLGDQVETPDLATDPGKNRLRQFQLLSSPHQNQRHSTHLKDLQSLFASIPPPPPPLPMRVAPPSIPPPPSSSNLFNPLHFSQPYSLPYHQTDDASGSRDSSPQRNDTPVKRHRHPSGFKQSLTPTPSKRFNFSPYTPEHRVYAAAAGATVDESPWELMSARHLHQRSITESYPANGDNDNYYSDLANKNTTPNHFKAPTTTTVSATTNSANANSHNVKPYFDTSRYFMNKVRADPLSNNNISNSNNDKPLPSTISNNTRSDEDNSNVCGDSL